MSDKGKKRKKKSYYQQNKFRKNDGLVLSPNDQGFLLTCNFQERSCVRDGYSLLNEYANQLFGEEKFGENNDSENSDTDEDVEAAMKREISEIKESKKVPRRFQSIDLGVKNCVFIKTTLEDPVKLISTIFDDILTKKEAKSRYILRFLPITHTCKVNDDDIKKCVNQMFADFNEKRPDKNAEFEYCVMFKHRYNNQVKREDFYSHIEVGLLEQNIEFKVKFDNPEYVVIIDVIKNMCCMSIVTNYEKYKKYNIAELINPTLTKLKDKTAAKTVDSVENVSGELKNSEPEEIKECGGPSTANLSENNGGNSVEIIEKPGSKENTD